MDSTDEQTLKRDSKRYVELVSAMRSLAREWRMDGDAIRVDCASNLDRVVDGVVHR